jgi:hypothetical protein
MSACWGALTGVARSLKRRDDSENKVTGWTDEDLQTEVSEYVEILQHIVGALQRHGLVRDIAVGTWDYIRRYGLTEFGVLCLNRLQAEITRTQATGEDRN